MPYWLKVLRGKPHKMSHHFRVMRGDIKMSHHLRVMRGRPHKMSHHLRVMRGAT